MGARWRAQLGPSLLMGLAAFGCALERSDPEPAAVVSIPVPADQEPTIIMAEAPPPPRGDAGKAAASAPLSRFCGLGTCLPSDQNACENWSPATLALDSGVRESAAARDAGLTDAAAPLADAGPAQPVDAAAPAHAYSCQLTLVREAEVERACRPSGTRQVEESCHNSTDCAPGLACTGMQFGGRCLPVCCAEQSGVSASESCQPGFHCTHRPLREESLGAIDGPDVPVCVRAEACSLRERSPCEGAGCTCDPDEMCSLVDVSGTTACVPKGKGRASDPCPCAPDHICSAAGTCQMLCELGDEGNSACGEGALEGVCELAGGLEGVGLGVCVLNPGAEAPPPL